MHKDLPEKEIRAILKTIEKFTGQGAVYHGLRDDALLTNRKVTKFCDFCLKHPATAPFCRYASCDATMQALSSGEPSFRRCWAGLMFVTVPIAPKNICCGGISAGGFYTEAERDETLDMLKRALSPRYDGDIDQFTALLPSLREIAPSALRGLGFFLMETGFSSGINSPIFFRNQNARYQQQRQIAEEFADIKTRAADDSDILGDTYQLLFYLNREDRENAMRFISKHLARLLLASNWNLTKLKAHLRVLLAVMTSKDILSGTDWMTATSREMLYMARIEEAKTTEDACYETAEAVMRYFRDQDSRSEERSTIAERMTAWLHSHYHEKASLNAASKAIGASVSSIVQHLRKDMGKSSKEILKEIRVSQAKKLLATTEMEISEIAQLCGFSDQSHFTKQFKYAINLTPGEFRRLLHFGKEEI